MTQGYDLYIASKAEYLEFENSSLKAQLDVANRRVAELEGQIAKEESSADEIITLLNSAFRRINDLELEQYRLLEQLQEVRDAYDEASVEIAYLESRIYGDRGAY